MKPSESKVYVDLIKSLREYGVKEMKVEGFQVTFEPGEAAQILAPAIEFAPPTSQQLVALKKQAEETAFEERADEVLSQLQIDDPEAFEDALIQQELEASEREDENPITFD